MKTCQEKSSAQCRLSRDGRATVGNAEPGNLDHATAHLHSTKSRISGAVVGTSLSTFGSYLMLAHGLGVLLAPALLELWRPRHVVATMPRAVVVLAVIMAAVIVAAVIVVPRRRPGGPADGAGSTFPTPPTERPQLPTRG